MISFIGETKGADFTGQRDRVGFAWNLSRKDPKGTPESGMGKCGNIPKEDWILRGSERTTYLEFVASTGTQDTPQKPMTGRCSQIAGDSKGTEEAREYILSASTHVHGKGRRRAVVSN